MEVSKRTGLQNACKRSYKAKSQRLATHGEVFSKQSLKFPDVHKSNEKTRGKQKRRDRTRTKSGSGQKQPRKQQDLLMQIKAKEELLQTTSKENAGAQKNVMSLITRNRITQKLGIYGKGKSSETVTRRKALGEIKVPNHTATQQDLKRVLNVSPSSCSSACSTLQPLQNLPQNHITSPQPPPCGMGRGGSSCNEMECSPHSHTPPSLSPTPIPSPIAKIPLKEIAQRLADSLHPEELFPGTDYLRNVKAELRKLMKQSDPNSYSQFSRLAEESMTCGSPLAEQGVACYGMQPTSYLPQENTPNLSSLAMLFGASANPSTSTHSHPPTSTQSLLPPITDSLPAVILAADDATATMLPPLCPPTEIDCGLQSSDFLDILDKSDNSAATSSKQWMPTPDRPRMFPRKLY